MHPMPILAVLGVLALAGCGSDDKTVVVQPPQSSGTVVTPAPANPPASQGNTVIVPQSTDRVCPDGTVRC